MGARICGAILAFAALVALHLSTEMAQGAPIDTAELKAVSSSGTVYLKVTAQDNAVTTEEIGTAFLISDDGYAVTAYHVVSDWAHTAKKNQEASPISAKLGGPQGEPLGSVRIIDQDELLDFALLKIDGVGQAKRLPVCFRSKLVEGRDIYAAGFADGHALALTEGKFSSDGANVPFDPSNPTNTNNNPAHYWESSIGFAHGMSGGPVFDEWGNVVAFVQGGAVQSEVTKFVVPLSRAKAKIADHVAVLQTCGPASDQAEDNATKFDPAISPTIELAASEPKLPLGYNVRFYGKAFDQRTGPVPDAQLQWSDGGSQSATGAIFNPRILATGTYRMYLTAKAPVGREGLAVSTLSIVQPEVTLGQVGRYGDGACTSVAFDGNNVAFIMKPKIGTGSTLYSGRVGESGLVSLKVIKSVNSSLFSHPLSIGRNLLFLSVNQRVEIWSLGEQSGPKFEATLPLPDGLSSADNIEASDDFAIVRNGDSVLGIKLPVDGTTFFDGGSPGMASGMGIIGERVVLPRRWQKLALLRPSAPGKTEVAGTEIDQLSTNVVQVGEDGVVAVASWKGAFGLLKLNDDDTATKLSVITGAGNAWRMAAWEDIIFIASNSDGLIGINVNDHARPRIVFGSMEFGAVFDVAIRKGKILVCSERGLYVVQPQRVSLK